MTLALLLDSLACDQSEAQGFHDDRSALQDGPTGSELTPKAVAAEAPPPPPPPLADALWKALQSEAVAQVGQNPILLVSATKHPATVLVELRADSDGRIFEHALEVAELKAGEFIELPVPLYALGIVPELQFASMIEGKLHVTRNGHTRSYAIDPVHMHPFQDGFLIYNERGDFQ